MIDLAPASPARAGECHQDRPRAALGLSSEPGRPGRPRRHDPNRRLGACRADPVGRSAGAVDQPPCVRRPRANPHPEPPARFTGERGDPPAGSAVTEARALRRDERHPPPQQVADLRRQRRLWPPRADRDRERECLTGPDRLLSCGFREPDRRRAGADLGRHPREVVGAVAVGRGRSDGGGVPQAADGLRPRDDRDPGHASGGERPQPADDRLGSVTRTAWGMRGGDLRRR
jgi:hypothetical protein